MKTYGFLSFGHYSLDPRSGPDARHVLQDGLEIARAADELSIYGAYFPVHHFAPQGASPIPLLGAIAGSTKHIEVGTDVVDMRYENPLQLAEELVALDLLSNGRVALGVSRGSPEPALRGWESFGYRAEAPNGADMARTKFETFLAAILGHAVAEAAPLDQQYPRMYRPGTALPVFPHSENLDQRVWWGSGTTKSAEQLHVTA